MGPEWDSCKDILGDMKADTRATIFGPRSDSTVEVQLPAAINSFGPDLGMSGWRGGSLPIKRNDD